MNRISHAWPFRAHSVVPCTFVGRVALAMVLLLVAGSVAAGQAQKIKVCHVDSETGNVNLIVVSPNSNHLENPAHEFGGLKDFTPEEALASGRGTEDSNGDGVDDGCEPPEGVPCPCFNETDLLAVTFENQNSFGSCDNDLPLYANIYTGNGTHEFIADQDGSHSFLASKGCVAKDTLTVVLTNDDLAIQTCVNLIAERCQEITKDSN